MMTVDRLARLRISVHRTFPEARADWSGAEEHGICYAFQSYCWLSCWHRCVGHRIVPCLVAVEDEAGIPVLFLPLGIERRGGASCLIWLGGRITDYHAPILGPAFPSLCREVAFPELWAFIRRRLPPFDAVHFEKQPATIEGHANPFLELGGVLHPRTAHTASLCRDWDDLYARRCGGRTRSTDRRKERRLADFGPPVFQPTTASEDVMPMVAALIALKTKRYRTTGARNLFSTPGYDAFFRELAQCKAGDVTVQLSTLTVGGRVAAVLWGLVFRRRYYYLVPAFDEDSFGSASPGALLTRRVLQWACEHDLDVFDFTIGDESYKDRWCDSVIPLWDKLEAVSLAGRFYVAGRVAARQVKGLLRQTPTVARLCKRGVMVAKSLTRQPAKGDDPPDNCR